MTELIERGRPETEKAERKRGQDFSLLEDVTGGKRAAVVFGAGAVGRAVVHYLTGISPKVRLAGIAVTDPSANPEVVLGRRVYGIRELKHSCAQAVIMVALSEQAQAEALATIRECGFRQVLSITPELEWKLHRAYQEAVFPAGALNASLIGRIRQSSHRQETGQDDEKREARGNGSREPAAAKEPGYPAGFTIYEARCEKDRPLFRAERGDVRVEAVQAGACLAEGSATGLRDDTGENISSKNRSYCELTVLYWLWKNCPDAYWGLCHYRRRFELEEAQLTAVMASGIDVILPVPTVLYTSVEQHYLDCHGAGKWNVMRRVLEEKYPAYAKSADSVFHNPVFYEYNMLAGRRSVMDEYCGWLFDILEEVERRCGKAEEGYQGRYIGFLAERLLTLYFFHNRKRYHITHSYIQQLF